MATKGIHYLSFDFKTNMTFSPLKKTKKTGSLQVKFQVSETDEKTRVKVQLNTPQEPLIQVPWGVSVFRDQDPALVTKKSINLRVTNPRLVDFWERFNRFMIQTAYDRRAEWFPDQEDPSKEFLKQTYYPVWGQSKKSRDNGYEPTLRAKCFDFKDRPKSSIKVFNLNPETNIMIAGKCSDIDTGSQGMFNVVLDSVWFKAMQWGVTIIVTEAAIMPSQEQSDPSELFDWGSSPVPVLATESKEKEETEDLPLNRPSLKRSPPDSILMQGSASGLPAPKRIRSDNSQ